MMPIFLGAEAVAASMSVASPRGKRHEDWQYHPRSDLHSKVACWVALTDLLSASSLLRRHAVEGRVVIGVNYEIRDFETNRRKNLDLVIGRPAAGASVGSQSLSDLQEAFQVALSKDQKRAVQSLPVLRVGSVQAVLVALEAKAVMTAHSKALPRLYDELTSSHVVVHGNSSRALAVGLVIVNVSSTFVSPGKRDPICRHRQPGDARVVIEKLRELRRRTTPDGVGFDGLGVILLSCANDGTPVTLVTGDPAPPEFHYAAMITRIANEYDGSFRFI
jgi:hypothetical protein